MKLPVPVDKKTFEVLNRGTNIIFQSERSDFQECERIMERIVSLFWDAGIMKLMK